MFVRLLRIPVLCPANIWVASLMLSHAIFIRFVFNNKSHDAKHTQALIHLSHTIQNATIDLLLLFLLALSFLLDLCFSRLIHFPMISFVFFFFFFFIFHFHSFVCCASLSTCTHSALGILEENRFIYYTFVVLWRIFSLFLLFTFILTCAIVDFHSRAFVRILCVCCPRKIRKKYQPTMRSKASQVSNIKYTYLVYRRVCVVSTWIVCIVVVVVVLW